MRSRLSDPQAQLLRVLRTRVGPDPWIATPGASDGPPALVLESFEAEPWASLTFSGMRHSVELRLDGATGAVDTVHDDLALWALEPECGLAGHFLAELQITETAREVRDGGRMSLSLRLEALTIEE
jgi:hypothetical protein